LPLILIDYTKGIPYNAAISFRRKLIVSNLLLITDMARLNRIFERLADDGAFTLRVVNNLERGGEEITIQKPDVVFVQTHLSGFSADILLKHLKKQLGRKRSRFVLLATPQEVNDDILTPYHDWLDISYKDSELLSAIQNLLTSPISKNKTPDAQIQPEEITVSSSVSAEPATINEASAPLSPQPAADAIPAVSVNLSQTLPAVATEASLEDQGIIYPRLARLSVYSEFNSSFDNAVNSTPEPESLAKASPAPDHKWNTELIDTIETVSPRTKRATFLLWLAPVVVAVVVVTFLQKNGTVSKPVAVVATPVVSPATPSKTADISIPATFQRSESSKPPLPVKPDQDSKMTDRAVITAIAENRGPKVNVPTSAPSARPSALPDFIPRSGFDKQYGIANPGWERYKGRVTEFKVLREAEKIKAIQVIDRGGEGVPESFMKGVLRQVEKKPVFKAETTEKKEGYEIQRGRVSNNIRVVYYRDENGGTLRAFVMSWQ
jgi:hypothetical protein